MHVYTTLGLRSWTHLYLTPCQTRNALQACNFNLALQQTQVRRQKKPHLQSDEQCFYHPGCSEQETIFTILSLHVLARLFFVTLLWASAVTHKTLPCPHIYSLIVFLNSVKSASFTAVLVHEGKPKSRPKSSENVFCSAWPFPSNELLKNKCR